MSELLLLLILAFIFIFTPDTYIGSKYRLSVYLICNNRYWYRPWKTHIGRPLHRTAGSPIRPITAHQFIRILITTTSNQIKSLLLSHHHSTSALVSEILMSVLQTVQKNNRQFTYGQTVQKKKKKKQQTIYIWTDSAKNCTGAFTVLQTVQKKTNNSNLHMDRQCKKATAIYIWTVHIYRLYRRQCAKYTYIYSVHIVYYKDILNYQLHIIHRMGTSALCTLSIHYVVYT